MKGLQLAASFVFMPLLLREFGLANYGIFMLASSVSVYLGLLDFGMSSTVTKLVAEHSARGENDDLGRIISNAFAYYMGVGAVAFLGLLAFARYGVGIFHLSAGDMDLARALFLVSALVSLFTWPLSIGVSTLSGLQRYDLVARVGGLIVIGNVVATAFVAGAGLGPVELLAAMGAVSVIGGLLGVIAARRNLGRDVSVSWRLIDRSTLRRVFAFSWPVFIIQVTALATDMQTDRLVLATFVGAAAVGIYESAAKLNGLVGQLAPLTTVAVVPMASKLDAEARPETLRSLFLRGTKYTIAFAAPIAISLMVLARPLLYHWLGPLFASHALAAQILLLTWVIHSNLVVAFTMFIGTGHLRFLTRFNVSQATLNLVLSIVLVRRLGVLGVVIGTVVPELILLPVGVRYVLRTLGVNLRWYLNSVVYRTYPLLLIPAAIGSAAVALGVTGSMLGVAVVGGAAVVSYWIAFYLTGLTIEERADLMAQLAAITGRSQA